MTTQTYVLTHDVLRLKADATIAAARERLRRHYGDVVDLWLAGCEVWHTGYADGDATWLMYELHDPYAFPGNETLRSSGSVTELPHVEGHIGGYGSGATHTYGPCATCSEPWEVQA